MNSPNGSAPPLHQIVITNLPDEVLNQIDHLARATDRSRSAMSRVLLVRALTAYDGQSASLPNTLDEPRSNT